MNQNEFFNILMDGLKDLPESKLRELVSYYDNQFTHGKSLGKTEEEIIAELGNPNLIVNQYKSEFLDINDISIPFETESNTDASIKNTEIINDKISDNIGTDNIINTISDNYFNNINSINNSKIAIDDEILSTADIPENNDFYNLYTSNQPVKSDESNYDNNTSDSQNYNYSSTNSSPKNSQSKVNLILKICIIVVTLLIFSPVITGIIGCIIGLFGIAISILVGSIGLLIGGTFTSLVNVPNVPMFVANFPYPVIVLFSLGSISLSLFLTLVFYYLCKFFVRLLIKAYRALKLKGGDL